MPKHVDTNVRNQGQCKNQIKMIPRKEINEAAQSLTLKNTQSVNCQTKNSKYLLNEVWWAPKTYQQLRKIRKTMHE